MRQTPRIFDALPRFIFAISLFSCFLGLDESAAQAFRMVRTGSGPTVRIGAETLKFPWMGGLTASQIAEMDVNGDGTTDLLVFDKTENHLMVLLRTRLPSGEVVHTPAPEYADLFPPIWYWMVLGDLEGDGDPDLFTSSNGGVRVYENIGSVGQPLFRLRSSIKSILPAWVYCLILVAACGVLYLHTTSYGYTELDDSIFIREFEQYNKQDSSYVHSFRRGVFSETSDTYYRPLLLASFVFDRHREGKLQSTLHSESAATDSISTYHLSNVLLHGIAVLLLFFLLRLMRCNNSVAFVIAVIFAVHPALVQAV
ncbi:MAG: VCBS repeat-containing protein, partial [Bacteroidetes bacterium]|nr:VCBS repeat-containing protein [Bacteroidota bacterium]